MNLTDAINAMIDNDDAINFATRSLLIDSTDIAAAIDAANDYDDNAYAADRRRAALTMIAALIELAADDAETMTDLLLAYSLCPMHAIDYAICFDDDDADCAAIRLIHPSHDS